VWTRRGHRLRGGCEWQAGGQDVVFVSFVAVGVQREAPYLGVAGVFQAAQLQVAVVIAVDDGVDVGASGPVADINLSDLCQRLAWAVRGGAQRR